MTQFNENQYKQQIEAAVSTFKRRRQRIEESQNPYYEMPGVREFEIEKLREEMDAEVERVNKEFDAAITAELDTAKRAAARSRFYVSDTARKDVEHMVDSFIADASFATSEASKVEAFAAFEDNLNTLDEAALSVVRLQLPKIAQALGGDKALERDLRMLHSTLKKLKTPEQERYEELQALKARGVDLPHRMMKIVQSRKK